MTTNGRKFELYYGQGGHVGPYFSLFGACRDAARRLRGCRSETRIVVKDRAVADVTKATLVVLEKCSDGKIILAIPGIGRRK